MKKILVLGTAVLIFIVSFILARNIEETEGPVAFKKNPLFEKTAQILKSKNFIPTVKVSKNEVLSIRGKERYQKLANTAGILQADHPLMNTIIGLENPQLVDHQTAEKFNNDLIEYLKKNPEKGFEEIKRILGSTQAKEDPALRGNMMIALSYIEGKEEEVREISLNELENNIIQEEKELPVGRDLSTNNNLKEEIAVVLAFNAFLGVSQKTAQNIDDETINLIKKQPNINVKRQLAVSYDRVYPQNREMMLNKLKEEGIELFPPDFKVRTNEQ